MVRSLFIGALLAVALAVPALADGDGPILSTGSETEIHMDFSNAKNTRGRSSFIRENVRSGRKRRGATSRPRNQRGDSVAAGNVSVHPNRSGAADTIKAYAKNHDWLVAENKKLKEDVAEMKDAIDELNEKKADKDPDADPDPDPDTAGKTPGGDAVGGSTQPPTVSTAGTTQTNVGENWTWKDYLSMILFALSTVCGVAALVNLARIPFIKGETTEEGAPMSAASGFPGDMDDDDEPPTARARAFGWFVRFGIAAVALLGLSYGVPHLPF